MVTRAGRTDPALPYRKVWFALRVSARAFMSALVFLLVVSHIQASALAGTRQAVAGTETSVPTRPISYQVRAWYDPHTTVLKIEASIELETPGRTQVDFTLPSYFGIETVDVPTHRWWAWSQLASAAGISSYRLWLNDPDGTESIRIVYAGIVEVRDTTEDRYWSRATSDVIWISEPAHWLPLPSKSVLDETRFDVELTVPAGWRVLVPNCQPSRVSPSDDQTVTYVYTSSPQEKQWPLRWVAGPYSAHSGKTASGLTYRVWYTPKYREAADAIYSETPSILRFCESTLGAFRAETLDLIVVPPAQGGGQAFPPEAVIIAADDGRTPIDSAHPAQVWAHELSHLASPEIDEGLADFLGVLYLQTQRPEMFPEATRLLRYYYYRAVARYGDYSVCAAATGTTPDRRAYRYAKPALIWHMFRGVYGDEAVSSLMRALRERLLQVRGLAAEDYYRLIAELAAGVGGDTARRFCERWFLTDYSMDLAIGTPLAHPAGSNDDTWVLSFEVEDRGNPPAREAIPFAEVRVIYGQPVAELLTRIELIGRETRVSLNVRGRPLEVTLDPQEWLLDRDPSNNHALVELRQPLGVRQVVPALCAAVFTAVAAWALARRPRRIAGPPVAGRGTVRG